MPQAADAMPPCHKMAGMAQSEHDSAKPIAKSCCGGSLSSCQCTHGCVGAPALLTSVATPVAAPNPLPHDATAVPQPLRAFAATLIRPPISTPL